MADLPDTVGNTLHIFSSTANAFRSGYCYFHHFTAEEAEVQRG